jgi:hypothetical protein
LQLRLILFLSCTVLCDINLNDYVNDNITVMNSNKMTPFSGSMIVSLRYNCRHDNDNVDDVMTHCCTGTIVSASYILTAAHCVDRFNDVADDRWLDRMTITTAGVHTRPTREQISRKVDEIRIHPQWRKSSLNIRYDIALLHLSSPLDFDIDNDIDRTCLLTSRMISSYSSYDAWQTPSHQLIVEWNTVKEDFQGSTSYGLRYIDVTLLDRTDPICNQSMVHIEQGCYMYKVDTITGLFLLDECNREN